jgi:drug/metabolite transporter (DMT)-like permease
MSRIQPLPDTTPTTLPAGLMGRLWGNAYLLLTLTTLMWGGNAVASRLAVGHISPMALTSLRWVGVCLIVPVLMRRELAAHWPAIRANWRMIAGMGMLGFTVFNALMYLAAHTTSAINMGIIQGSIPVFVLAGAWLVYGTRIGLMQYAGVTVTVAGVMLTAARGDLGVLSSLAFAEGDLFMIIACAFYAGYTVALRNRPNVPGLVFFSMMALAACIFSAGLLVWEIAAGKVQWPDAQGLLVTLYVTLFPSILSQLFFMRGVDLIGPGRAGLFVNLVPIWAAFLAVLILNEPFALYHAAALALVLGGIWLAERKAG